MSRTVIENKYLPPSVKFSSVKTFIVPQEEMWFASVVKNTNNTKYGHTGQDLTHKTQGCLQAT